MGQSSVPGVCAVPVCKQVRQAAARSSLLFLCPPHRFQFTPLFLRVTEAICSPAPGCEAPGVASRQLAGDTLAGGVLLEDGALAPDSSAPPRWCASLRVNGFLVGASSGQTRPCLGRAAALHRRGGVARSRRPASHRVPRGDGPLAPGPRFASPPRTGGGSDSLAALWGSTCRALRSQWPAAGAGRAAHAADGDGEMQRRPNHSRSRRPRSLWSGVPAVGRARRAWHVQASPGSGRRGGVNEAGKSQV